MLGVWRLPESNKGRKGLLVKIIMLMLLSDMIGEWRIPWTSLRDGKEKRCWFDGY